MAQSQMSAGEAANEAGAYTYAHLEVMVKSWGWVIFTCSDSN